MLISLHITNHPKFGEIDLNMVATDQSRTDNSLVYVAAIDKKISRIALLYGEEPDKYLSCIFRGFLRAIGSGAVYDNKLKYDVRMMFAATDGVYDIDVKDNKRTIEYIKDIHQDPQIVEDISKKDKEVIYLMYGYMDKILATKYKHPLIVRKDLQTFIDNIESIGSTRTQLISNTHYTDLMYIIDPDEIWICDWYRRGQERINNFHSLREYEDIDKYNDKGLLPIMYLNGRFGGIPL